MNFRNIPQKDRVKWYMSLSKEERDAFKEERMKEIKQDKYKKIRMGVLIGLLILCISILCISFFGCSGEGIIILKDYKEGVDLGTIAKARGGGGHPGAAGFHCDELPFDLQGRDNG